MSLPRSNERGLYRSAFKRFTPVCIWGDRFPLAARVANVFLRPVTDPPSEEPTPRRTTTLVIAFVLELWETPPVSLCLAAVVCRWSYFLSVANRNCPARPLLPVACMFSPLFLVFVGDSPCFVLGLSFKRRRLFTPVVIAARPQLRARRSSVSLPYAAICRSVLLLFCSLRFCAHRCVQVPPPSGVVATLLMFFSNLPLRHTPLAAFSPQDLTCVTTCKAQASPPVPRPAVTPLVCLHCLSEHAQHMDRQNIVPVPLARSRMSRVLVSHGQPAAMPRLRRRLKSVWPTPLSPPLRVPLTPPRCLPFVAVAVSRRRCLRASRHAASDFACH